MDGAGEHGCEEESHAKVSGVVASDVVIKDFVEGDRVRVSGKLGICGE